MTFASFPFAVSLISLSPHGLPGEIDSEFRETANARIRVALNETSIDQGFDIGPFVIRH